ncbi:hypothetical protein F1188_16535 [Roseospira marina]|uniref:Uncharacterized protein n=1 Tax=Roseospira marina TaxID=140057 RepID=A0A5M6I987_9PROT|nr:hypothetical protein [Roseospira marina]KAA5604299.1 hypothetical protein F1188_16535 [Roseospira marina]MBB4315677.1 hypothetical protein [Roseospira marina]MBB5088735.1 hypothetical protein [Roseospira marina]
MDNTPLELDNIIELEREFFSDILTTNANITPDMKAAFRNETIAERRQRLCRELYQEFEGRVMEGPFRGLFLEPTPAWSASDQCSMLLGTYEAEVVALLFSPATAHRDHLVNLGGG